MIRNDVMRYTGLILWERVTRVHVKDNVNFIQTFYVLQVHSNGKVVLGTQAGL